MLDKFISLLLVCLLMGCASTSEEAKLQRILQQAQEAADQQAKQELVAFMSLEIMFPDPQVRALAKAAGRGRIRKIDELFGRGVDVNARGTSGATPLFWAMKNAKGFRRLLELGADPNAVFEDGGVELGCVTFPLTVKP